MGNAFSLSKLPLILIFIVVIYLTIESCKVPWNLGKKKILAPFLAPKKC